MKKTRKNTIKRHLISCIVMKTDRYELILLIKILYSFIGYNWLILVSSKLIYIETTKTQLIKTKKKKISISKKDKNKVNKEKKLSISEVSVKKKLGTGGVGIKNLGKSRVNTNKVNKPSINIANIANNICIGVVDVTNAE